MKKYYQGIILLLGLAILVAVVFAPFLSGKHVLLTTDAAIAGSNPPLTELLPKLAYHWNARPLLGTSGAMFCKLPALLMLFIHGIAWNNWIYPIACIGSSIAFYFFLRKKGLIGVSVALGSLTAFWLGSNFTLIFPGHMLKPYVVMFFVLSLIPAAKAGSGSLAAGLIWGSCVGLMFVQQTDIAMFFALFSGAYLIFNLGTKQGFKPIAWIKILVPAALIAFLFAAGPLLNGYNKYVKGSAQMQSGNASAKWDYVTQWSWPPEESTAFIAPGYTGWRSGEPEGPYWGRMGRSPEWEKTGQGFQNFKLENTYLGLVPLGFAVFALVSCRRSKHRSEILFWSGASAVALLLAFGKFFPFYALFYKFPVVNSIRNPNKFLQVFQVCTAVLSAYGAHALFCGSEVKPEGKEALVPRKFFWGIVALLAVLGAGALSLALNRSEDVVHFAKLGWPSDMAKVIVDNKVAALGHAVFMSASLALVFAFYSFPRLGKLIPLKRYVGIAVVVLVAADAVQLSKHYLKEMPRSYIAANPLTDFLKTNIEQQRVALLSQQGIDNIWITYLLPYNRISTFNFSDMPRMANDYKALLTAGQRDPLNMWRFSAVRYILAPANAQKQLSAAGCRKVFAYGLADAGHGEFKVVPNPNGPLSVYELLNTLPRYALFAGAQTGSDDQALASMADFSKVVVPEDSPLPELNGSGQTGSVDLMSYRDGKVKLRVNTEVPAILRCADRYDDGWKASVDGKRATVSRVDFLCQGVYIPAGEHILIMKYAPSHHFFYMQCAGYSILCASLVVLMLRRKGRNVAD